MRGLSVHVDLGDLVEADPLTSLFELVGAGVEVG